MTTSDDVRAPARERGRPLEGITVLDFSQFLAGPVAALRLSDLGARVIKVERPGIGELGRTLAFADLRRDGDSLTFHAMNRGKESLAADLKSSDDLELVRRMVRSADVLVENFRPGVMRRLGLDYESVRAINPGIVYGSISGYGAGGPWADKPGQDLLAQARSGLPWLSGDRRSPPVPVGLSIADHLASCQLALGVAALLVRRERTGEGGLVETSLLEGVLDFQFELLTAYFNEPAFGLRRSGVHGANAYLSAPYGVYPTADGYLALAMYPVPKIGALLEMPELERYADPDSWTTDREHIATLLGERLASEPTRHWLDILEPADVWCAPVLTLPELAASDGFAAIDMLQEVTRPDGDGAGEVALTTTRSPLRVDGQRLVGSAGAPHVGEHTGALRREFADPDPRAAADAAAR
ncbi:MAG TPA: CaiB/BaiF CoA-transferase family protein [Acidimicrobiales bacterium]|nr:CaiB/BaiF CoA-transferase family protein [Acidimicrobiales bacterium]